MTLLGLFNICAVCQKLSGLIFYYAHDFKIHDCQLLDRFRSFRLPIVALLNGIAGFDRYLA